MLIRVGIERVGLFYILEIDEFKIIIILFSAISMVNFNFAYIEVIKQENFCSY